MFKALATAAALVIASTAAQADQITLDAPMAAASLHTGGIDMVVYFLEHDDHFEVVSTYVENIQAVTPYRMRMALVDGDSVNFGLPDQPQVVYGFSRTGDVVTIESTLTGVTFASK